MHAPGVGSCLVGVVTMTSSWGRWTHTGAATLPGIRLLWSVWHNIYPRLGLMWVDINTNCTLWFKVHFNMLTWLEKLSHCGSVIPCVLTRSVFHSHVLHNRLIVILIYTAVTGAVQAHVSAASHGRKRDLKRLCTLQVYFFQQYASKCEDESQYKGTESI